MLVSERRALRSADVVHVEFGSLDGACFWFGLMAALLRDDVVAVVHDPPLMALAPGAALIRTGTRWRDVVGHRLLAPLLDGCLRRAFARRVAVGVTLSEPGRRAWVGPAPSRLQVLDLGADPPSAGAPPPSAGAHVLFAGFIAPGKGIEVLLEAWAKVGRSTRLPLVIAGDETPGPSNGYRASLQESSRRLASPPRWLGAVSDEEFASLVSRAAIVVLPYLRSNPASGVLVRAMVEGRAIVASRVPAALDALTDGGDGLLVPVGEAAPLGDALAGLLADGALRDRLGAAAAARATGRFTWERHTAGLERAYRLAGAR
jgi:glycosyltransferase involved in cell wall biosynthesis